MGWWSVKRQAFGGHCFGCANGVFFDCEDRPYTALHTGSERLEASEDEVEALESSIVANPAIGDVIPGLGGIRKLRFKLGNKGKRGGGRAIYFLMVTDDLAFMLFAYAKNEQEDLTREQKGAALALLKEIKNDR